MKAERYSVFQLEEQTLQYSSFPADLYSRYKYGCVASTEFMAGLMTQLITTNCADWIGHDIVVIPSAYKHVPAAAVALSKIVNTQLNFNVYQTTWAAVKRRRVFDGDYGRLGYGDRIELMINNDLYLDKSSFENKKVIAIDDIRVTGAHEQRLHTTLERSGVAHVRYFYIAQVINPKRTDIEHRLNHALVQRIEELEDIISSGRFGLNARVCKFLMSYPDQAALSAFLKKRTFTFLSDLQHAVTADGYDQMRLYAANALLLKSLLLQASESLQRVGMR